MKKIVNSIIIICAIICIGCTDEYIPQVDDNGENFEFVSDDSTGKNVSFAELFRVVRDCVGVENKSLSRGDDVVTIYDFNHRPVMYVVNFANNNGYIIVSAQKSYFPLLAKINHGNFEQDLQLVPALREWKDNAINIISLSSELPEDSVAYATETWRKYEDANFFASEAKSRDYKPGEIDPSVYQRLTAISRDSVLSWMGKGYDVYSLTEYKEKHRDVADEFDGFAFTSVWPEYEAVYEDLALVVEYTKDYVSGTGDMIKTKWNQDYEYCESFPPVGRLEHAYAGCTTVAVGQVMYKYKYPTYIQWDKMPLTMGNTTISDFFYSLASKSSPDYTDEGTKITLLNIKNTLENYFGYTASLSLYNTSKIKSEIEAGRPVVADSETVKYGKKSSHSWVIGGYRMLVIDYHTELWTFTDPYKYQCVHEIFQESTPGGKMYYINWGNGGYGDGLYIDLSDPLPANPAYTSNIPGNMLTMRPK